MPFGCPLLELYVWPRNPDGSQSVAYFCGRIGCLCVCCREDFTKPEEEYPRYCPTEGEFGSYDGDDEYDDQEEDFDDSDDDSDLAFDV
jgi:hypothetical protein